MCWCFRFCFRFFLCAFCVVGETRWGDAEELLTLLSEFTREMLWDGQRTQLPGSRHTDGCIIIMPVRERPLITIEQYSGAVNVGQYVHGKVTNKESSEKLFTRIKLPNPRKTFLSPWLFTHQTKLDQRSRRSNFERTVNDNMTRTTTISEKHCFVRVRVSTENEQPCPSRMHRTPVRLRQ